MSLRESIEEARYNKQSEPCPLAKIIETLDEEDKKAIFDALQNKIPDVTLATALRKEGYKISELSISRHRREICRCITSK